MLKRILFFLFLGLVLAFIINRLYEEYLRPDNLFFSKCLEQTHEWEQYIRQKNQPCYVFAGGSEVRMGIDPEVMWERYQVPAINAGMQAGNGIRCNIQSALPFTRPGDTLVVSLRLPSDAKPVEDMSHAGVNFCFKHQGISMYQDGIIPMNYKTLSPLLIGDSVNYSIHLIRLMTRSECIYRYESESNARISRGGRVEVFLTNEQNVRLPNNVLKTNVKFEEPSFTNWLSLLQDMKDECDRRSVRLVAYISRSHQSGVIRPYYAHMALFLTRHGIPVLKDPYLGAWEDNRAFSDTALHFSIEGGREYSAELAKLLKSHTFWSELELDDIIKLGLN